MIYLDPEYGIQQPLHAENSVIRAGRPMLQMVSRVYGLTQLEAGTVLKVHYGGEYMGYLERPIDISESLDDVRTVISLTPRSIVYTSSGVPKHFSSSQILFPLGTITFPTKKELEYFSKLKTI